MNTIVAKELSKSFGESKVLDSLSLDVERGELLAIIGPSGVGKTTLLRILNGLTPPDNGTVEVMGKKLQYHNDQDLKQRRRMSLISQKPVALRNTVWNNIAYPLQLRGIEEADEKVNAAMEHVRLTEMADQAASTLSGGELQRLAFARATVYAPEILLLDEFTSHLDPYNITVLENAVKWYLESKNATVIMVTHNLFQAKRIATSAAFLLDGKIIEKGATEKVFNQPDDKRTLAFVNGEMVF